MDEFWSAEQMSFRRKAHDYFLRQGLSLSSGIDVTPAMIFGDLGSAPGPATLSQAVLIIEEASLLSSRLGRDLLRRRAFRGPEGPTEDRLCHLASMAGTAAHVFEAGARAARARGLFASSLMGCREVQESLAGLASGVEILRLGICRVCHLLDRGERERGEAESTVLYEKARVLLHDARSVAAGLLGEAWITDNIDGDASPSRNERNRS